MSASTPAGQTPYYFVPAPSRHPALMAVGLFLVIFGAGQWVNHVGWGAWVLLAGSYLPTLRRFGRSAAWAPLLPLIAAFYMAATIGSAFNHHFGRGVSWKGRAYEGEGR